ncbi:hypothetical protein H1C71_020426, partial [Ictidomys tridecemlineatus]
DIHPTVPNLYNLLITLNPERKWYTVLDLKDAFFCLPLHKDSQLLFAFEWVDPETRMSGQLTWTRLPQRFKNSPTLFDEALHRDLNNFRTTHPEVTLLQYVDDLLLAADTKENCESGTQALLPELAQLGYRASAKKAQVCQQEVIFLGYFLRGGKQWLTEPRKQTVVQIPPPSNRRADEEAKLAALNGVTMLTLSTLGEHKSGDLTTSEHPDNLTSKDTDTELLDFTEPSLQFQKALHYVKNVHQLTHLGSKKLQAFLKDQEQSFPLTGSQQKEIA